MSQLDAVDSGREVLERSDRHDVEEEREKDWERAGCDREQKGRMGMGE